MATLPCDCRLPLRLELALARVAGASWAHGALAIARHGRYDKRGESAEGIFSLHNDNSDSSMAPNPRTLSAVLFLNQPSGASPRAEGTRPVWLGRRAFSPLDR